MMALIFFAIRIGLSVWLAHTFGWQPVVFTFLLWGITFSFRD
jgi:hypothetical protein